MAFLRIVHTHMDPSKRDEFDSLAAEGLAFEAAAPGLQCRHVAYDPATGDGLIAVVFETREQAEAGIPISDEYRAKLSALGREAPSVTVMHVTHEFRPEKVSV